MKKGSRIKWIALCGVAAIVLGFVAVQVWISTLDSGSPALGGISSDQAITFLDDVEPNTNKVPDLSRIRFLDLEGQSVALADYLENQNVVLVFTRGYPGYLCLYCRTQTSRLITNYDRFRALNAEVLVVFPGSSEDVQKLIEDAKKETQSENVPFPVLLDAEFRAVDEFGIRGNLAKPSTYIFDKQGDLRFAYVGEKLDDRPSIKAILNQLEFIAR